MAQIAYKCTNSDFKNSKPNGFDNTCALCTVFLKVSENYVVYNRKNFTEFILKEVCDFFDGMLKPTCEAFIHYAGPTIINTVTNNW
jgi:hypothetical protein